MEFKRKHYVRSQSHWLQDYYISLSEGLHKQWDNSQYTDTQVTVGSKTFSCHRVVLSAMSPFFEAMYLSGMRESREGVVTLQDIESETFESILTFIYTGVDVVNEENVDNILRVSVMLQIKGLRERCEEFMIENVNPENCVASWKLAAAHECNFLEQKALKYVLHHFEEVCETGDFLKLDCEELMSVITSNDLRTHNEELVCEAVFKWIHHEAENRTQYIAKLFENLRLPLMQPEYLLGTVECNEFVQESSECKEFVEEAKRYHLLPARKHEFVSTRLVHRNHGKYEEVIICFGGNHHRERTTRDVSCYSMKQMEWIKLGQLPYDPGVEFAVCIYGNAVFLSGGSEKLIGMVYFLLTTQNTWLECARMLLGRRRHCMVAVGDSLYVLGGYDDDESEEQYRTILNIEKFDVVSGRWNDCGYLRFPVRSASASVVQDKIYVFGGIDGDGGMLESVQCFDTRLSTCTHVTNLPSLAGMSSAVVCNKTTYLVFPSGDVAKMEAGGEIETVGSIPNFDRCGFGLIQHEGELVVLGGIDSSEIYDDLITYHPTDKAAKLTEHQMLRPLFGFGCVKATISKSFLRWK